MRFIICLLLSALLTDIVCAHDLWLIPPERAEPGKVVKIVAHSGDLFPKSEQAPDPSNFVKRRVLHPDGTEHEMTADGTKEQSGLMRFSPEKPGVHLVAIETKPKHIKLEAAAFNEYLVSDGLAHIYRLRHMEKSLDQPGAEQYQKSPKAIFLVGKGEGDPCRVMGLTLEIVPKKNPLELKVGETLPVFVLFKGKPLAEANLGWDWPGAGERPRGTARTDTKGEALVPIACAGLMTIRLTHMTRPKAAEYEWESFWTTLTFRTGD